MRQIALLLLLAIALGSSVAFGYDFGCQDVWEGPSASNDLEECARKVPTDNGGILVPPIIPAVFLVFLFVLFPVGFFCRCCGACGSNKVRPGADCCCDGEEWDDLEDEEKVAVYPSRHVFCFKVLCLVVTALCAAPVVLMPIGATYGVDFWDSFLASANTDVIDWVENLKVSFENDLRLANGSYPAPLSNSTFDDLQNFIDDARDILSDVDDTFQSNMDTVNKVVQIIAFVPMILCAVMLLFILCSVRRVLPACFMWIYYLVSLLFALACIVLMVLGVFFVLLSGEVELQQFKAPGIFQWYAVPACEEKATFLSLKADFQEANKAQAVDICNRFLEVCDDLAFGPNVAGVSSLKPFYCTLTSADVDSQCASVDTVALMINGTYSKPGAPICTNCTVGECPTTCTVEAARNQTAEIQSELVVGLRIIKAVDRAFIYCDCDVLLTQGMKPFADSDQAAMGSFLAAAGTGLGALFLMFGIILLCKGQKLFFASPEARYKSVQPAD
eukprot:GDKK01048164.1.p1 GENE.GDKK01048164.1~~GDKK01048164.1.p1  ORF type:complete len:502 (+),score=23.47 GDKK01048164.1:37-1542(+)